MANSDSQSSIRYGTMRIFDKPCSSRKPWPGERLAGSSILMGRSCPNFFESLTSIFTRGRRKTSIRLFPSSAGGVNRFPDLTMRHSRRSIDGNEPSQRPVGSMISAWEAHRLLDRMSPALDSDESYLMKTNLMKAAAHGNSRWVLSLPKMLYYRAESIRRTDLFSITP